ncbi:hypothetical protein L873DRAFT_1097106, partial [Choiromyces venosus 120613-1]
MLVIHLVVLVHSCLPNLTFKHKKGSYRRQLKLLAIWLFFIQYTIMNLTLLSTSRVELSCILKCIVNTHFQ